MFLKPRSSFYWQKGGYFRNCKGPISQVLLDVGTQVMSMMFLPHEEVSKTEDREKQGYRTRDAMCLGHVLSQGLETFSVKGQTVNTLGFAFQRASDATLQQL